jgi:hypothetical protein
MLISYFLYIVETTSQLVIEILRDFRISLVSARKMCVKWLAAVFWWSSVEGRTRLRIAYRRGYRPINQNQEFENGSCCFAPPGGGWVLDGCGKTWAKQPAASQQPAAGQPLASSDISAAFAARTLQISYIDRLHQALSQARRADSQSTTLVV